MTNKQSISIEQHKTRIRSAGYKLTYARISILEIIHTLGGHCTSSEILDAVAEFDEGIGRASVFRTLDLLTQLNIIRPTYVDTSTTPQYVMMPDGHHHHIICTNCNRVFEFENCGLSGLTHQLERHFDLEITGHLLEFYAKCADCSVVEP